MADELHFDDPLRAAADPATDAEALRQLAYRYPETRAAVAAHPRAYRGLLDSATPPSTRRSRRARTTTGTSTPTASSS